MNPHRPYSPHLHDALYEASVALGDVEVAQAVFSTVDLAAALVRPNEFGFEIGGRRHRLHVHFVLELTHGGGLSLGPRGDPEGEGVQRRLQRYYSEALGIAGVHVRADLLRAQSAAKNYNRKQQEYYEPGDDHGGRLLEGGVIIDRSGR